MQIDEKDDNMLELKSFEVKDELTGMYNREMFEFDMERKLKRAKDKGTSIALFCMDLDSLGQLAKRNDAYDAELAVYTSGVFVKEFVKEMNDKAYRIGDDEFAVVVVGKHDYDMEIMAECLVDGIAELGIRFKEKKTNDGELDTNTLEYLTASVGAVWCEEANSHTTVELLLESAVDALKRAKSLGGNRYIITEV